MLVFAPKTIAIAGGTIGYEVAGTGSSILCLPGIGDRRQVYDRFAPMLVAAGFRVMVADLRGQGESSVGWNRYDVEALASDIAPLLDAEGIDSAILIGGSLSGATTACFAAQFPQRVAGLIGLGPIRRLPFTGIKAKVMSVVLQAMLADPWGVNMWGNYYRTLYPTPPADLDEYIAALKANLREPGRMEALRKMIQAGRNPEILKAVQVPVLDFIGTADPDFEQPQQEADWTKSMMPQAEVHLLPGLGHYIQRESPSTILPRVIEFAQRAFDLFNSGNRP